MKVRGIRGSRGIVRRLRSYRRQLILLQDWRDQREELLYLRIRDLEQELVAYQKQAEQLAELRGLTKVPD